MQAKEQAIQAGAVNMMVAGGDNIGPRELFWNLVSTTPARIEQAKQDWRDGKFAMVPGDDEFIPLPD